MLSNAQFQAALRNLHSEGVSLHVSLHRHSKAVNLSAKRAFENQFDEIVKEGFEQEWSGEFKRLYGMSIELRAMLTMNEKVAAYHKSDMLLKDLAALTACI